MRISRTARRPATPAVLALGALALGSCATYPQRTAGALDAFQRGELDAARRAFADPKTTGSPFLQGAEAGTVALAAGEWLEAREGLEAAAEVARELEDRALVSAADLGQGLLTLAVSESARTYQGEGFERVMLHATLGLTYLALGEVDGVLVEAKRANALLEREEELYEKDYRAGGLAHLVSALAYELLDEPDQAYIDYERMVQRDLGSQLAGRALVRLAARLRYEDELARWSERFGPDTERPEGAASIVLVAGVGLAPFKQEITLPIPTSSGILQWSVPTYVARPQPVGGLVLRDLSTDSAVRTDVVEDVGAVARENLDDRIAWLAAKSAVRAIMKRELTQHLEQNYDLVGRIAGDVFAFVTERADLRSWLTLPDTWQAARLFVPPGEHTLVLESLGGEQAPLGTFALEPGETMFVLARSVGRRLYAHPVGGLRLGASAPAPAAAATRVP